MGWLALSLNVGLAAALVGTFPFPLGGLARSLSLFVVVDKLAVFILGSLLPLGFTDGSTLLRSWGKR